MLKPESAELLLWRQRKELTVPGRENAQHNWECWRFLRATSHLTLGKKQTVSRSDIGKVGKDQDPKGL